MLHRALSEKVISAFYKVYRTLGHGFLEKVYENAMLLELEKQGLNVQQQKRINVYYDGKVVGVYFADLIVEGTIIIELKASASLRKEHEYQLINYLKATDKEVGFLVNFGKEPQFTRKIFTNDRKEWLNNK